eukprot:PhM_4_TR8863/c0_g1_i1/m.52476
MFRPCGERIRTELRDTLTRHFATRAQLLSESARSTLTKLGVATDLSKVSANAVRAVRVTDVRFTSVSSKDVDVRAPLELVLRHMKIPGSTRASLRKHFLEDVCNGEDEDANVATTLFWFVYCAFFQATEVRSFLPWFSKFSRTLCNIVLSLDRNAVEVYPYIISHTVCLSLFATYPGSSSLFTDNFVNRVYQLIILLVTGTEQTVRFCTFMREKYFVHEKLKLPVSRGIVSTEETAMLNAQREGSVLAVSESPSLKPPLRVNQNNKNMSSENNTKKLSVSGGGENGLMTMVVDPRTGFLLPERRAGVQVEQDLHDPDFNIFNSDILDWENAAAVIRKREVEQQQQQKQRANNSTSSTSSPIKATGHGRPDITLDSFIERNTASGGYATSKATPTTTTRSSSRALTDAVVHNFQKPYRGIRDGETPAGVPLIQYVSQYVGDSGAAGLLEYARSHRMPEGLKSMLHSPRADPLAVDMARNFALVDGVEDVIDLTSPRARLQESFRLKTLYDIDEFGTGSTRKPDLPPEARGVASRQSANRPATTMATPDPDLPLPRNSATPSSIHSTAMAMTTTSTHCMQVADALQLRKQQPAIEDGDGRCRTSMGRLEPLDMSRPTTTTETHLTVGTLRDTDDHASTADDIIAVVRRSRPNSRAEPSKLPPPSRQTLSRARSVPPTAPSSHDGMGTDLPMLTRAELIHDQNLRRMRQDAQGTVSSCVSLNQPNAMIRMSLSRSRGTNRILKTTVGYETNDTSMENAEKVRRSTADVLRTHREDRDLQRLNNRRFELKCRNDARALKEQARECMRDPGEVERLVEGIMATPSMAEHQTVASYLSRRGVHENQFRGTLLAEKASLTAQQVNKSLKKLEKSCAAAMAARNRSMAY